MNLSPHFTLDEFTVSQTAARHGLDNALPDDLLPNARQTCEGLEVVRTLLSNKAGRYVPIFISSGYRSPQVNRLVGGTSESDHTKGLAADWIAPAFGTPYQIIAFLQARREFRFDKLIHEYGRWVHSSFAQDRRIVLSIFQPGEYLQGLVEKGDAA